VQKSRDEATCDDITCFIYYTGDKINKSRIMLNETQACS